MSVAAVIQSQVCSLLSITCWKRFGAVWKDNPTLLHLLRQVLGTCRQESLLLRWVSHGGQKAHSQRAAEVREGCAPSSAPGMFMGLPVVATAEGIGFLLSSCSCHRRRGRNAKDQAVRSHVFLQWVHLPVQKGPEKRCGWDDSGCVTSLVQTLELRRVEDVIFRFYLRLFDQAHSLPASWS